MGRQYKRKSNGQFAGGGGFKRVQRAMTRIGIQTKGGVAAVKARNKVDRRRETRRAQTVLRRAQRTGNI